MRATAPIEQRRGPACSAVQSKRPSFTPVKPTRSFARVRSWPTTVTLTPQWQVIQLWVFCRIDYPLATPALGALARQESIYKTVKFSDHAPITVDYDFDL